MLFVQLILTYRVYAIYNCNRRLLSFLLVLFFFTSTASAATIIVQTRIDDPSINNEPAPGIYLCGSTAVPKFIWACYIPLLIFETVVFLLMAHKAVMQWGIKLLPSGSDATVGEKLVRVLFYDSFIYFISVLGIFTTMTFLFRFTSASVFNTATGPAFAMISILGSHMILNPPSIYDDTRREEYNLTPMIPLSNPRFVRPQSGIEKSTELT
ncbi:hypothetical protein SISSUDRAFT_1061825 [Sistotremastrum suecicum HHB10207 ss-3]|uniref:Uncharacterized protein n=1 Tax=Sistotremastrum suecicum HHB10207 ss-3 TaxID=1314776 RepID=A0A166DM33_9AGAM|nr:hypothetical protein SISSUDRAFT_1061825 [Sistotremastrum suecicum HHB10207 ss-3]